MHSLIIVNDFNSIMDLIKDDKFKIEEYSKDVICTKEIIDEINKEESHLNFFVSNNLNLIDVENLFSMPHGVEYYLEKALLISVSDYCHHSLISRIVSSDQVSFIEKRN